MRKVAIVGANGMLGRDVAETLGSLSPVCADLPELDITSINDTVNFVSAHKPDVVINCAAYTDVDGCESNAGLAYSVNAFGVKHLAIACEKVGAEFMHISTDYVFDGGKGTPYIESDPTNPLNVYGKSKLSGEQELMNHMSRFYILRSQWMFGSNGKNFVKTMLGLAAQRKRISVVGDQFGCPTYSLDLARLIAQVIETGQYGVYHATNCGIVSWYQFATEIFQAAHVDTGVTQVTTEQYPRPAKRPKYSALDNMALRLAGFPEMRGYREALEEYLRKDQCI